MRSFRKLRTKHDMVDWFDFFDWFIQKVDLSFSLHTFLETNINGIRLHFFKRQNYKICNTNISSRHILVPKNVTHPIQFPANEKTFSFHHSFPFCQFPRAAKLLTSHSFPSWNRIWILKFKVVDCYKTLRMNEMNEWIRWNNLG